MTNNVNINTNLYKLNVMEELREGSPADVSHQEITISKTEVKEEVYDFEKPVNDIEFVNVEEKHFSSVEDSFKEENLEVIKSEQELLNEYLVFGACDFNKVSHHESTYVCELCHTGFEEEVLLKSHYEQCLFAQEKLKTHIHLQRNNNVRKSTQKHCTSLKYSRESKKYKCEDCNYTTDKQNNLTKHITTHSNERPFKCTYKNCNCTPEQKKSCKCNMCGYASKRVKNLKIHMLLRHSQETKKYTCSVCKYSSHIKGDLMRHTRIHTNERPFKCTYKDCKCTPGQEQSCECDTCGYAAARNHALKNHILARHSAESKKYKCLDCTFTTHLKGNLEVHFRIHTMNKPFKCTYKNCKCTPGQEESCKCNKCRYATVHNQDLKKHILTRHSTEPKKYKCADCKFATHLKGNLKEHCLTHTNNRLFKCTYKNCKCTHGQEESCNCDVCGYTSLRNKDLKKHILVRHSAEPKKFKCTDCKFATHIKGNLEVHFRTHTKNLASVTCANMQL